MYTIITPSGDEISPPEGRCWRHLESVYKELLADGRLWFGNDGKGVPRKKTYLSETDGVAPWTWWQNSEVGHNQEAKKESNVLFGSANAFATPKPERLLERIIHIASNPGDVVLDSFLGSGTTSAVAHKMGRRWIGIEMGNHAYTHCKVRMDKVVDGEQGGISSSENWQGGGGYCFYELAPTLIVNDVHGNPIFSPQYNATMLTAAVAKINGFFYAPDPNTFWKQGYSQDNSFIYVTTQYFTAKMLDDIAHDLGSMERLLICAPAFDVGLGKRYDNIEVRKIPQTVLKKCEFSVDNYDLNIVNPPVIDEDEWEDDEDA